MKAQGRERSGAPLQDEDALPATITHQAPHSADQRSEVIDYFEKNDYAAFWDERRIEDAAQKYLLRRWVDTGGAVVELGGGFGRIAKVLESRFGTSVLVDLSNRNIGVARGYLARTNIAKSDVASTPFRDSTFDCVVMMRVIHLLTNPLAVFREIERIAKDGATVVVSIPNQALISAFMGFAKLSRLGRNRRGEDAFIPSPWPYKNGSYLLAPMDMFPPSFKLTGRKGTGIFENPIGRRLSRFKLLYLIEAATFPLWMFKFEILLRFEVRKEHRGANGAMSKRASKGPHTRA